MKKFKRSIAIIFVMVMALSVVAVGVQAATLSTTTSDYGYMMPTDSKFTKPVSTVKLYGSYDYLNLYIDAEYDNTYFFYEIYSDKDYTKLVSADYVYCEDRGTYTWAPMIKLKGVFSSKTYYCITYGAKMDSSGNVKLSTPSVSEFKLVVDRTTAFNKQVVLLKNVKTTVNGPQITWYKHSSAATKYVVYRRSINGTKWTKVGTVNAPTLTFTDKSVKEKSGTYVYTVKALNKSGTASRYQFSGLTSDFVAAPVIKSIITQADNKIKIEWNKTSCKFYRVYRKTNGGSWEKIVPEYYGTSYTDTKVQSGNTYEYTVKAMKNWSVTSAFYAGNKVDYVAGPELLPVKAVDKGLEVSWNEAKGATAYTVYRRPLDKSSGWVSLGKVNADVLNFVDETAESDGAYLYTVRSEGTTSRGSYNSKGIEYLVLQEPLMTVTETDDGVKINWDAVPGATKYEVYYRIYGGEWIKEADVSGRSYNMEVNVCGEIEFSVRAVRNNRFSEYATPSQPIMFFPEVSATTSIYKDFNLVQWTNVKADSYNLYRKNKDADDSEYVLIYSGDKTSYKDTDVMYDTGYTYVAKAVSNSVEQSENLNTSTRVRYDPEKYINSFNVTKKFNSYGSAFFNISYELTDLAKGMEPDVYCLSGSSTSTYWEHIDLGYPAVHHVRPATEKAQLTIVLSDGVGSTPMDAVMSIVENEKCAKPEFSYNAVKDGVEFFWDAMDGADSYELRVSGDKDFCREVKCDGSSTYRVFVSSEEYNEIIKKDKKYIEMYLTVTHTNGNITEGDERGVGYNSEPPKMVMVCETSNGVAVCFGDEYISGEYVIFRKAPGETSWKRIGSITRYGGSSQDYVDKTAKKGVKYTYTVRKAGGGKGCYMSYYDTKGMTVDKIITPKLTEISNTPYGVNVECEPIEASRFCVNYHIYRKTENGKWEKIGVSRASEGLAYNGFTDKTAKTGVKYYYTMIATYCSAKSSYDPTGISIVCVQTPTLKSATRTSAGVTVKWSEVEGADGYYVYRKTASSGWSRVGTIKNGSTVAFTDKTAKSGTTYTYTVKAYSGSNTSAYNKTGIKCK